MFCIIRFYKTLGTRFKIRYNRQEFHKHLGNDKGAMHFSFYFLTRLTTMLLNSMAYRQKTFRCNAKKIKWKNVVICCVQDTEVEEGK